MTNTIGGLLIIGLVSFSCKAKQPLAGEYYSGGLSRSNLVLDSNSSFRFTSDNYLFLGTDKYFFYTSGNWKKNKDTLILSSTVDTSLLPQHQIEKSSSNEEMSTFTFFNNAGDTIWLHRWDVNGIIHGKIHKYYSFIKHNVHKGDTVIFYFNFGYKPLVIPIEENKQSRYTVILNREYNSGYFNNAGFKIKKGKLKVISSGDTFKRRKKGI